MDTNETEQTKMGCLYLMLASLLFGIIFHIIGLWFNISIWFERICCFGLFFGVAGYYNVKLGFYQLDKLDKIEQFKLLFIFLPCIAMFYFAIDKNYEQVERERTEKENKFQQECIQQANEEYPCRDSRDWGCSILKERYIKACKIIAIDWRDIEITVAFNTKDKMAGTLAIGTAIMIDTFPAIGAYLSRLLRDGKDAKFGGIRWAQDFVIKMGLYKVPSEIAFGDSNKKHSSKDLFLNLASSNIFIALCAVAICIWGLFYCQLLFDIFIKSVEFLFRKDRNLK